MAILAECPFCHKKQAVKNKRCDCGADIEKLKRAKEKVRYWIAYRLPGGKQKREAVGYSIEEARDADGKRRSQKRENRIFDIKPEAKMTFSELAEWFLSSRKGEGQGILYNSRNQPEELSQRIFGSMTVMRHKAGQSGKLPGGCKKEAGYSDSYVDHEIGAARTMINKAFDNDIVGGDTLKAFKKVKKLLKPNANARDRILSLDEFERLMQHLPRHAKAIIATGFYTGMRRGEICFPDLGQGGYERAGYQTRGGRYKRR